jgi:hypothetical protein
MSRERCPHRETRGEALLERCHQCVLPLRFLMPAGTTDLTDRQVLPTLAIDPGAAVEMTANQRESTDTPSSSALHAQVYGHPHCAGVLRFRVRFPSDTGLPHDEPDPVCRGQAPSDCGAADLHHLVASSQTMPSWTITVPLALRRETIAATRLRTSSSS